MRNLDEYKTILRQNISSEECLTKNYNQATSESILTVASD